MKILIIIIFIFTLSCSKNKVSNIHGYRAIENKYQKLSININNKNDVKKLVGPPSSISEFDNKWFYIEREKTNQSIVKMGTKKINKNNILVLHFDNLGILKNKEILTIDNMNNIKLVKSKTQKKFKQNNLIYNVFSSFREKINAPTRNRKK